LTERIYPVGIGPVKLHDLYHKYEFALMQTIICTCLREEKSCRHINASIRILARWGNSTVGECGGRFQICFCPIAKRKFSYSATGFNKLGQKRPSLGPCLFLCMENMPLGMSARLVNAQLFSSGRVPVSYFGEEKKC
jgi:hypothetical protein